MGTFALLEKNHVPDYSLEKRLQQGDEKAFEMIFKANYASLVGYALKILNDREEAEEMVQEVFVTVWEKRRELNIEVSLKSYLYRSVHNRSLNQKAKANVRRMYADQQSDNHNHTEANTLLHHNELQMQLSQALDKLPEQCRKVFELSRFEGLKYAEIATHMNIALKTVENQMGKALRILREELNDFLTVYLLFLISGYFN